MICKPHCNFCVSVICVYLKYSFPIENTVTVGFVIYCVITGCFYFFTNIIKRKNVFICVHVAVSAGTNKPIHQ